jgi:hypothetical protein
MWTVVCKSHSCSVALGSVPNITHIDEEIWKEMVDSHLLPQVNCVTELILTQLMLTGEIIC